MIFIKKNQEPKSLLAYRANKTNLLDITYDNFQDKDDIREALLQEQGHICAYCMQRIKKDTMKIEHFASQSVHPRLQLDYKNMLGCCKGGEGLHPENQHCDTKKANSSLKFNPSNPNHKTNLAIKYKPDGEIVSEDREFNNNLNEVLNLNLELLKNNRGRVWKQVLRDFSQISGRATQKNCETILERYQNPKNGELTPYCGIAIYYIQKRLDQFE